ncbi:hypothetical protein DL767_003273 [Monosporascus sp. MG133]|nr:hypothetical protein DL767_003273 [Monosporascus sp. MG133]
MRNMDSRSVPFDSSNQLCDRLVIGIREQLNTETRVTAIERRKLPRGNGQVGERSSKDYLPGERRIQLCDPHISNYLKSELLTEDLNRLSPRLWLVAKQDSSHISSLTNQLVRGRQIIITEKPELHLVWYNDRVFIKPIPKYLLSHAFWEFYLLSPSSPIEASVGGDLFKAALGFLRSYNYLIRHRSDFALAMREDCRLLPKNTKYASFIRLIQSFETVDDGAVSPRYKFGELRLSRLNFWAKIFLFRFTYHKTDGQYGAYFARFFGPILFVFAVFSVLLSAMQVVLAAQTLVESDNGPWDVFTRMSRVFSVFTILSAAVVILVLLLVLLAMLSREAVFALRDLYREGRSRKSQSMGNSHHHEAEAGER